MSDVVLITLVIVVGILILVGILTAGIVGLVKHMPDKTFNNRPDVTKRPRTVSRDPLEATRPDKDSE